MDHVDLGVMYILGCVVRSPHLSIFCMVLGNFFLSIKRWENCSTTVIATKKKHVLLASWEGEASEAIYVYVNLYRYIYIYTY